MRLTTCEKESLLECLHTEGVQHVLQKPLILQQYLKHKSEMEINKIIKFYVTKASKYDYFNVENTNCKVFVDIERVEETCVDLKQQPPTTRDPAASASYYRESELLSTLVDKWHRVIPDSSTCREVEGMFLSLVSKVFKEEAKKLQDAGNSQVAGLYRYLIYVLEGCVSTPPNEPSIELSARQGRLILNLISDLERFAQHFRDSMRKEEYEIKIQQKFSDSFWKFFKLMDSPSIKPTGRVAEEGKLDSVQSHDSLIRELLQPLNPYNVEPLKLYRN